MWILESRSLSNPWRTSSLCAANLGSPSTSLSGASCLYPSEAWGLPTPAICPWWFEGRVTSCPLHYRQGVWSCRCSPRVVGCYGQTISCYSRCWRDACWWMRWRLVSLCAWEVSLACWCGLRLWWLTHLLTGLRRELAFCSEQVSDFCVGIARLDLARKSMWKSSVEPARNWDHHYQST